MTENRTVTNTEKPVLSIDLGHELGVVNWRSIDEIEEWLEHERTGWAWLRTALPLDQSIAGIMKLQLWQEGVLKDSVTQARSAASEKDLQRALNSLSSALIERFVQRRAIPSSSPRAKYIFSIKDPVVAAHVLGSMLGNDPPAPTRHALLGAFLAFAYESQLNPDTSRAVADSLTESLAQLKIEHEALRAQAGELADRFSSLASDVGSLHADQRKTFDQGEQQRRTAFDTTMDVTKESLKSLEETYNKKLALDSAVQYFQKKARNHMVLSWMFGIAAAVVGVLFVFFANEFAGAFLAGVNTQSEGVPVAPAWEIVAVAGLAATLVFWGLRILVRLLLSHLHLHTDMKSRATLMQTYLSLIREGSGLKDDDRKLIIQMLFRPITDGLVRDDAAPPGPWDAINRLVSGGGR